MTEKLAFRIILSVSLTVFALVVVLFNMPHAEHMPDWVKVLPKLNAAINSTCTLLLIAALLAIRRGKVSRHRNLMITTFGLSAIFLVSYCVFHSFGVETRYPADSAWRPFYLVILLTHILLASAVLPLVLMAFYFALSGQIPRHRRMVKWTFPIWLYVTSTGVIVYAMISPYYQF